MVAGDRSKLWLAPPCDSCGCNIMMDPPSRSLPGGSQARSPTWMSLGVGKSLTLTASSFPWGQSHFSFRKGKAPRTGSPTPSRTSPQSDCQPQRRQGQSTDACEWAGWADKAANSRIQSLAIYTQKKPSLQGVMTTSLNI